MVGCADDPAPLTLAEEHSMKGNGGDDEAGGYHGSREHPEVDPALELVEVREPGGEGEGEEEPRQDLHSGLGDAQFLEEFVQVAGQPLVVVLGSECGTVSAAYGFFQLRLVHLRATRDALAFGLVVKLRLRSAARTLV